MNKIEHVAPPVGSKFTKIHKKVLYTLDVVEGGYLVLGKLFDSPSGAAKFCTNRPTSGWDWWKIEKVGVAKVCSTPQGGPPLQLGPGRQETSGGTPDPEDARDPEEGDDETVGDLLQQLERELAKNKSLEIITQQRNEAVIARKREELAKLIQESGGT